MEFRIADTFTSSLARLTNDEQKAVKTTVFDLQVNPTNPGMQFHRIDKSKDSNFWSVRVSQDIRLIIHRTEGSFLICYVEHHDKAYQWAERRKIEQHPKTGAAQIVELRESIKEIVIPKYVEREEEVVQPKLVKPLPPLFADITAETLLGYGVPQEWVSEVQTSTEDSLFQIVSHLPQEAAEALLELATGGTPRKPETLPAANPFEHPDAKRRFTVIKTSEELALALNFPWDKWTIFLHPNQRSIVTKDFSGPARVSGSAGTGKTIVALHRAVNLAKANPESRVLLTTFSETLASSLQTRLRRLLTSEPRLGDRVEVHSVDEIGLQLYRRIDKTKRIVPESEIASLLTAAAASIPGHTFGAAFLKSEWDDIVDAWELRSWEEYRDVKRLGRKRRLSDAQRETLWKIFEAMRKSLEKSGLITKAEMFGAVARQIASFRNPPFDCAVVDEAQDVSIPQLRFLAALGGTRPNGLFFAGDLGQRIFQQPFSWKSIGVDVRGRSQILKVNYRTSHQIRSQADQLLAGSLADVDGNEESRLDTISTFEGEIPMVKTFPDEESEIESVGAWLSELSKKGFAQHEIGVFVRSEKQLDKARAAISKSGLTAALLDDRAETKFQSVSMGTMHLAKGLEFRAVAVMACDDEVIPLQERMESAGDESDLDEVYQSERHLLYVACTRARDALLVTGAEPASEFLEDLGKANARRD
jgi:superfamily I DNA/RNA helicase/mRNA-degrading endonuclease RelE of RelBE toxin-antitoxin system